MSALLRQKSGLNGQRYLLSADENDCFKNVWQRILDTVLEHIFQDTNGKTEKESSIKPYKDVVNFMEKNTTDIQLNAGHDLNLNNLEFILKEIPSIKEVSIGHALVCDAFTFGLEETIKKYLIITNVN